MDGNPEPTKVTNISLTRQRNRIRSEIVAVDEAIAVSKPPVVQELVIAKRALEDARMRLGVARALLNGDDPIKHENVDREEARREDEGEDEE